MLIIITNNSLKNVISQTAELLVKKSFYGF